MADSARRKRKWDVENPGEEGKEPSTTPQEGNTPNQTPPPPSRPSPSPSPSPAPPSSSSSSTPSSSAPAPSITPRASPPPPASGTGGFFEDIEINDLRNSNLMVRPQVHETIRRETGASVSTRGAYIADRSNPPNGSKPLHLHVAASNKETLDKGVARVKEMIEMAVNHRPGQPFPFLPGAGGQPMNFLTEKVFVDVEGDRYFPLKPKLLGPQGSYIKHIQSTSNTRVHLRGQGSGFVDPSTQKEAFEGLHFFISSQTQEGIDHARELCLDLIKTVKQEKEKFVQEGGMRRHMGPRPPPQHHGYPGYQQPPPDPYGGYPGYQGYPPPQTAYPPGPPGTYPAAPPGTAYPGYPSPYGAGYAQAGYAGYGYNNPYNPYNPYSNYVPTPGQEGGEAEKTEAGKNEPQSYSNVPPPSEHYQEADPLAVGVKETHRDYSNVPPPDYDNSEEPAKKRKLD